MNAYRMNPYTTKILLTCSLVLLMASCGRRYDVGDYYRSGTVSGVVVQLDDEGMPSLVLSLADTAHLNAEAALRWAETLQPAGQWRLPTIEEWKQMARNKAKINATLGKQRSAAIVAADTWYWSCTGADGQRIASSAVPTRVYAYGPLQAQVYFYDNASPRYVARAVCPVNSAE